MSWALPVTLLVNSLTVGRVGSVVWYEVGDSKTPVEGSHIYLRFCGELLLFDASWRAISDLRAEDGRYMD